jgi:S-adenosylmethionine-diacylglycerol 3-amino-3-carboxypropyl transferase
MLRRFDRTINYSSVNEDGRSDLRALSIQPQDVVLCVTGSGSRTLDLLTAKPQKIISLDMNPLQNFLLELKMAAMAQFDYGEYLAFLGIRPAAQRWQMYQALQFRLSAPARAFWNQQQAGISKGIFFQGRWEKYYRQLAKVLKLWRPQKLRQLFAGGDLAGQRAFYSEHWDTPAWRWFVRGVCQPRISQIFFRDPAFYRFVPENFNIAAYILQKLEQSFAHHIAGKNFFMALLFLGRFLDEACLPFHLQQAHFQTLREYHGAVKMVSQPLQQYLQTAAPRSFDKFSLSDVSSYTSAAEYEAIWQNLFTAARHGALVCARHFLVKRAPPPSVRDRIEHLHELERALERDDLSAFYSFNVVKIA